MIPAANTGLFTGAWPRLVPSCPEPQGLGHSHRGRQGSNDASWSTDAATRTPVAPSLRKPLAGPLSESAPPRDPSPSLKLFEPTPTREFRHGGDKQPLKEAGWRRHHEALPIPVEEISAIQDTIDSPRAPGAS